jgi:two-component system cell cycle sensor histidine kinase/response regulator CckA
MVKMLKGPRKESNLAHQEIFNLPNPKTKVLLVDDDPNNLLALQGMLESMPLDLILARSGPEALRQLLDHDVALILMDVQMPLLDGFETAALIRQRERSAHIPILFLTAGCKYDAHLKGYALGGVDYLLKPLVPEILTAKVAVFIELFRRAEQIQLQERMLRERAEEDLVASSANYRLLFDSNPRPMWVYDTENLTFLAVNDAALEKYGYSREQFLEMTIKHLRPPEDQTLEHTRSLRHQKKDRSIIDVEVASHEVVFAGRHARLEVATDITEKRKIEAQLLRTQRMESIGTLAGGIAHDLNNVLAPIVLGIQVLKDKFMDESSRQMIDTMERNARRGTNIVRQVLTFARGLEGEKVLIQPKHSLVNIENMLRQTLPKSVSVQLEIRQRLWVIVGDPTQVDQVLLNLCVNARDAMPEGGKLTIRADNVVLDESHARLNLQARAGAYVVIEVADTGHGMPPHIMEKIFDPFFTTKEVGKGTGLGLSTVQAILKSHGGFVNVYSELGKGTSFKVFFPAKESAEILELVAHQAELPAGNGELILVVDDEAAIREIAQITLESYNYRVLTAKDGIEAVAFYAEHSKEITAVLLDMMMPVMDGVATIRALEAIDPNVRVIAASGLVDATHTTNRVVRAVLAKPYTAEKLLKTLSGVLGTSCSGGL